MWKAVVLNLLIVSLLHPETSGEDEEPTVEEENPEEITTIEGYFFQDIFSEQLTPLQIQFGHVFENPDNWEQRFEEKDYAANRFKGKVKWGNKDGAYGESYWDINH